MKFKRILLIVAAFAIGFILFFLLAGNHKDKKDVIAAKRDYNITSRNDIRYSVGENKQPKLTMKQIDSMSANLNYKFTIENRISDSINAVNNVNPKAAEWKEKK